MKTTVEPSSGVDRRSHQATTNMTLNVLTFVCSIKFAHELVESHVYKHFVGILWGVVKIRAPYMSGFDICLLH